MKNEHFLTFWTFDIKAFIQWVPMRECWSLCCYFNSLKTISFPNETKIGQSNDFRWNVTSNTQYCYITGFSISFFPVTNYGLLLDVDFLISPISLVLLNIEIVMENYKISRIYTKKVVKVALTSGINNCWLKIRGCTFIAAELCSCICSVFSYRKNRIYIYVYFYPSYLI